MEIVAGLNGLRVASFSRAPVSKRWQTMSHALFPGCSLMLPIMSDVACPHRAQAQVAQTAQPKWARSWPRWLSKQADLGRSGRGLRGSGPSGPRICFKPLANYFKPFPTYVRQLSGPFHQLPRHFNPLPNHFQTTLKPL